LQNLQADENGEVATRTLPAQQQAAVQQVIAAQSLAEEYLGRGWLDWMTVGNTILIILLVAAGGFGYWSLSARIDKKANNEALDLFSANVASLGTRMNAAEADIADVRAQGGFRVITLEPGWREKVTATAVGVAVDLTVIGDGDAFATIVAERGDGDNIFITAGIDDQNARNGVKIDNLLTTVRKAAKPDEKKGGKIRLNNLVNRLQAVS
jgi:hypothetical protein